MANGAFLELPIQTGLLDPDFQGLIRRELITPAIPPGLANIGHLLNKVSHGCSPMEFTK
ncbi:hypothetical protein MRBBS_3368 [Marinobacter sp. BSs20148]|nr:hypothetical protein MRBBS_3368 [Marinobacter sp. BSs20148]